jgi:hypothetical protein
VRGGAGSCTSLCGATQVYVWVDHCGAPRGAPCAAIAFIHHPSSRILAAVATHRSCERCSDDLKVARCRPPPWRCPRVVQAHPLTTAVAHGVHARMATRGGGGVAPPRGGCTVGGVRQPGPPRVAIGGPTRGPPVGEDATREELGVAQGDANDG